MEKSKLFKGANNNDLNILIDVIIEKALDKDHNKMFDATHILSFKTKADTDVIARVSNQILGTNFDDVKKN
jgi:beta-glucosidase/6-phospho-beta-glucosidase/beta-galactosidase